MTWKSAADVGTPSRELSPDDRAAIEECLAVAAEWDADRMPFHVAASFGSIERQGVPSPGYTRLAAVLYTPPTDPRRAMLLALIDVLIRSQGFEITDQGIFSKPESHAHDTAVRLIRDAEGRAA